MIVSKEQVSNYIPHRAPFVMLDGLKTVEDKNFETIFEVSKENILVDDNGDFSTPGLIENIAQSCALGLGFINSKDGEKPKEGFIGAVSKLEAFSNPKIGDVITTKVEVIQELGPLVLVQGSSYINDQKLLSCEMKVVTAP